MRNFVLAKRDSELDQSFKRAEVGGQRGRSEKEN